MNESDTELLIVKRTKEARKTYGFQDQDDSLPADYWFQEAPEGLTLFLVLYTQACRWSQCLGCNLPSKVSKKHIPFHAIMKQADHVFSKILTEKQKRDLGKIILSNNGSVLDEETFPTSALIYFVAKMKAECPNIKVLSIETRPEYVDYAELEILSRALKEGERKTDLELAVGFEVFDEHLRNNHFHKGLTLDAFEKMVKQLARFHYHLKVYFMQKPVPNMSEEAGIEDIKQGIDYLAKVKNWSKVPMNMHLNPTYVATGTLLAKEFAEGRYSPPLLESVRKAALYAEGKGTSMFIGLNDEGLAVPGGSFIRKGDEHLIKALEEFNRTQDFSLLRQ